MKRVNDGQRQRDYLNSVGNRKKNNKKIKLDNYDDEEVDTGTNNHTKGIGHPLGQSTTSQSRLALPPGEVSRANNPLGQTPTLQGVWPRI